MGKYAPAFQRRSVCDARARIEAAIARAAMRQSQRGRRNGPTFDVGRRLPRVRYTTV